jgi:hypothetical protein
MTYLPPIYSQDADYLLKAQKTALTTNSLGLEKIGMLKNKNTSYFKIAFIIISS